MRVSETLRSSFPLPLQLRGQAALRWKTLAGKLIAALLVLLYSLSLLGSSAVPAAQVERLQLAALTSGWDWDFIRWEAGAISQKLRSQAVQPIRQLAALERAALVRSYLDSAQQIGAVEWQLDQVYAQPAPADSGAATGVPAADTARQAQRLEARLTVLREQQTLVRPAVEQIIETQVGDVLAQQQISGDRRHFPPVWFTFTEPPRKLIVSPRDRIATSYYAMLRPDLPAEQRAQIEDAIQDEHNQSAYVTQIGGLGAYPTIVTDQAPLPWVLSTVAHEWVHNYLTLFPLGLHYNSSSDLTILNETVADIAGDEIGAQVLATAYPELVREFPGKDQPAPSPADPNAPPPFDFNLEMRHTREVVDLFLHYGRVQDAEEYMQIRRQLFAENGYPLRKLNQAYFAFHGSYGTGAAATTPIGPKLQRLRAALPDLRTFLQTVRWFTSETDLDEALARLART